ncbi:pyruvate dehydrogenase complex dihydrolipoamide acetyltransferase [Aphanomyces invadans]|uniref:Dihydrolipoamide acetyltransferase component of pyruvate dehydrogenase complex n=1 Tax=Aphanomyces invadans TaxID=157072 RepID=A0A024U9M2_9STRA|nr:pyruvate dehydrogenase complex dihydrolipoamide acetyltransferase [Aphanomyces invadans]ETW02313.1 pyruvate dehydrogenase complex dihydrolipoamide acetyltransferase [Aphanomyces invadans]|eukprot:XP_008868918.1 pyruvate dehydrogenase complex dihydrolipoamide acetyltransferase [Aphanomyces invadans]
MRVVQVLQRTVARQLLVRPASVARAFSTLPDHEVVGLPALSPTMETGTISTWLKKEGDKITAGDIVCQIETDKAVVDFEAQDDSYLAKILKPEGTADVKVGEPIFVTVEDPSEIAAFGTFSLSGPAPAAVAPAPEAPKAATSTPAPVAAAPTPVLTATSTSSSGRVFASPLAKKVARDAGLALGSVTGTGPLGRILRADVDAVLAAGPVAPAVVSVGATTAPAASPVAASTSPVSFGDYTDFPLTAKAQQLAAQLTQQKLDVPHYHLTVDVALDKLLVARDLLNKTRKPEEHLSVNDFFLRAAALTMKKVPAANAAWLGNVIRQFHNVHINLLVAAEGGVVAPVVRQVNSKGLDQVNADVRSILAKGSSDDVAWAESDLETGTFTISNVGMFDVKSFAAIVSPNQSCSLGLGTITKRVVPNDDPDAEQIYKYSTQLTATLACDHRVIDGATGAQWLASFKELVEDPLRMIL